MPTSDLSRQSTAEADRRRIIFSVRNFWYLKFFDSVIGALADRGHYVHVLSEKGEGDEKVAEWTGAMQDLARRHSGVTFSWTPKRVGDDWVDLSLWLRRTIDYLRFLAPVFDDAPILRQRAETRAPRFLVPWLRPRWIRRSFVVSRLERMLNALDMALPGNSRLRDLLVRESADAVIITPLIALGSSQFDMLQAAREQGIPSALAVGSWDHLSSKALIRVAPDAVLVWNETQREEAQAFHGIDPSRVIVTGAQCFDHWFDRRPAWSADDFRARVGLPAGRPYLLYVCSALFEGSPSEAVFAHRWAEAIRACDDPVLQAMPILIRPHPKRAFEWDHVDVSDLPEVVLWPRQGQVPLSAEAKDVYFDSMFHSRAVVGLNTSALIESGIIGRPVYTMLLPEFWDNQEGTLHFHYLLDGGLLEASRSVDEHLGQLARELTRPDDSGARRAEFIRRFIRPHGLDKPATPIFIEAIETLASRRERVATTAPSWAGAARVALHPLALVLRDTAGTTALWREARYQQEDEERAAWKQQRRQQQESAREQARAERLSAARRDRDARIQQRVALKERHQAEKRKRRRLQALRSAAGGYYRRLFPRPGEDASRS